jgi:hypothetical protein
MQSSWNLSYKGLATTNTTIWNYIKLSILKIIKLSSCWLHNFYFGFSEDGTLALKYLAVSCIVYYFQSMYVQMFVNIITWQHLFIQRYCGLDWHWWHSCELVPFQTTHKCYYRRNDFHSFNAFIISFLTFVQFQNI